MPFDPSSLSHLLDLRGNTLGSSGSSVTSWAESGGETLTVSGTGTDAVVDATATPASGKAVKFQGGKFLQLGNHVVSSAASSAYGPTPGANLWDSNISTEWYTDAIGGPWWNSVRFDTSFVAASYQIRSSPSYNPTFDPKDWKLQGSTDGSTWVDIDTRSGETFASASLTKTYTITGTPASYDYYRLYITASGGAAGIHIGDVWIKSATTTYPRAWDIGAMEIWAVVKGASTADTSLWSMGAYGGFPQQYPFSGAIYEEFGRANERASFTPTVSLTSWRLYRIVSDSAGWQAWLDGTSQLSAAATSRGWAANILLGAGIRGPYAQQYNGWVAGVFIRPVRSTSGEVADLIGWFNTEYGLTVPGGTSIPSTTGTASITVGSSSASSTVPVVTGTAPVGVGSSSRTVPVAATTGSAPVAVASSSNTTLIGIVPVTTGTAPVDVASSSSTELVIPSTTTTGDAPVTVESSSVSSLLVTTTGDAPFVVGSSARTQPVLDDGAAEDLSHAVEDAAGPTALALGVAEVVSASVVDAAGGARFEVDQIDTVAEAWAEAYTDLSVALDPDTHRPQYRLKVVDRTGATICELADVQIGTATRSLNGRGGLDFSLGKNDPQLASVPQFAEVQLWRGAHLVPGGWFTVVDPQIDEGGDSFDYQCSGLTYYFERRLIGAERPEMLRNGGFEQGARFWSFGWSPGSNAETPPTWEVTSDALEGGKALRVFADDKVQTVKRTVESAAVFVPNSSAFLAGGEQKIRDQVADIPDKTHITIEGHTADSDGGTGYALSVARANAAAAVIHAYKPTLTYTTVGKGETEPVDPRHTEDAYRKNRRVVILANFTQTKVGHRQFAHQSFTASQDPSAREPLEFDIQGQGRIDDFDGPSKDGWMLYADVRKVSDPKHKILNNDHADVDETTARRVWMGLNLTVKVPADGLDYTVDVRAYPTAGSSSFDQISAKPNLKLAFWDMDPRNIIGGLVDHAQDATLGKSDLNIQAYGPLSGFKTKGVWEWKEAKPVSEAIDDLVRSLNGPDANIAVTPRRRLLVIHPKQGRDSGFVLASGDCAGDARILGYAAGIDGDEVTTQARVQTSWSGGGMVEQFVTLPRADGLTLENVYRADQDTPSSALLEQGRTAVKYGQADVVTRVAMHPDDTTLLMERVTIGDIVTLAIKDGRVDVNQRYRIIQIDLDPNSDQLAYTVAPEV